MFFSVNAKENYPRDILQIDLLSSFLSAQFFPFYLFFLLTIYLTVFQLFYLFICLSLSLLIYQLLRSFGQRVVLALEGRCQILLCITRPENHNLVDGFSPLFPLPRGSTGCSGFPLSFSSPPPLPVGYRERLKESERGRERKR